MPAPRRDSGWVKANEWQSHSYLNGFRVVGADSMSCIVWSVRRLRDRFSSLIRGTNHINPFGFYLFPYHYLGYHDVRM